MADLMKYLRRFPDVTPKELISILEVDAVKEPLEAVQALQDILENHNISPGMAAAVSYDCAIDITNPDFQMEAIKMYLAAKCTEFLGRERSSPDSFSPIFDAAINCPSAEQRYELSTAMGRLLIINPRWFQLLEATDMIRDHIQAEWINLLSSGHIHIKRPSIGVVADKLNGLLGACLSN